MLKTNLDIATLSEITEQSGDSPSPASENGQFSETILVVEDEETVRRLIIDILSMNGYRVLEAKDGKEALGLCKQHSAAIDLVVTDVIMPEMNGPQLAAHLEQLRPETLLIYMSGYTDDAIVRSGVLDEGIVSLIRKPFTPGELVCKVHETLEAAKN